MKPILVVYATREGQTRRIAEHLGAMLGAGEHSYELIDAGHAAEGFSLTNYSAAIVGASLHAGKYEPEMGKFVKRHVAEMQRMPTLFLPVSLTEVTVEDTQAPPESRAEAQAAVKQTIDKFLEETGWHPSYIAPVAGALRYSKYNFVIRFIMKRIAKKMGGPVDTSRDYEFTDWVKLDQVVEEFVHSATAEVPAVT